MVNDQTHNLKRARLGGETLFRSLIFVFVFIGLSISAYSQIVYTCGNTTVSGADALDAVAIIPADLANGAWTNDAGLTINDNGTTTASDDVIFGYSLAGSPYTLEWTADGGTVYSVDLVVSTDFPSVDSFVTDNPTPCGPYQPTIKIEVSGGLSPYEVDFQEDGSSVSSSPFSISGNTTIPINHGDADRVADISVQLISVTDGNGCKADLSSVADVTFVYTDVPKEVVVSGNNLCLPSSLSISISDANAEAGVTYYLAEGGTKVAGSEISTSPYNWSPSTVGSYTVYAENPCDPAAPILMNGGPFVLSDSPVTTYAIGFVESGPYCVGNSFTVDMANSEAGVTYSLVNPSGVTIDSETSISGGALQFSSGGVMLSEAGTYTIEADNGLCAAVNMDTTIEVEDVPNVVTVSGSDNCTPNALSISISAGDAQPGVTYYLYEASSGRVAGSDISSSPYMWNPATPGTYSVYAESSCGSDLLMNGGPYVLSQAPNAYSISFVESGPYCPGSSYTIELANSDVGVTYSLLDPTNTQVGVSQTSVVAGSINFGPQTLTVPGEYKIVASNGSCASVAMSNTVTLGTTPLVYSINTSTVCEGTDLTVKLLNSTVGMDYILKYDDGINPVSDVRTISSSPGGALSFTPVVTAIGTYYVVAQDASGCTSTMSGTATISPQPKDVPLNITGTVCPSGEISIGTVANPAEASVEYVLLRDGVPVLTKQGNDADANGVLSFGDQVTEGIYTVRAVSGSCTRVMTGSLKVYEEPDVLILSANKIKYCKSESLSDVNFTLSNVESSAGYQLQKFNGVDWDDEGAVRYGADGSDIVWSNKKEGIYRVMASVGSGACEVEMSNRITVEEVVEPSAAISAIMPNRRCANESSNFTLSVLLTGNAPFNFDIVDDKGNTIVNAVNYSLGTYTITVNPSDAQTIYHVENLTDAASCSPVDPVGTATIYVDPVPVIKFDPASPEVCLGSSISISADGAGAGGSYVWSDGLGASQTIAVQPSATDTYTVTATTDQGCVASDDITVIVNPLPVLTFDTPGSVYEFCEDDGLVSLTGNQSGATFSGPGVAIGGSIFNPDPSSTDVLIPVKASIGTNTIKYQYTDTKGCYNSIEKDIVVNALPVVNLNGLADSYCADAGTVSFNASPDGSAIGSTGTFSITGYDGGLHKGNWWDQNATAGGGAWINVGAALTALGPVDLNVCYTYVNANNCDETVCQTVTLIPDYSTHLNFTGLPNNVCQTAPSVTLTPYLSGVLITEPGDGTITFSGPGITDNADGTATFDPAEAGAGSHTITLDYTDLNGCQGATSQTIQIGTPLNLLNFPTEYCSSDGNAYTLIGQVNGVTPDPATSPTWFDVIDPAANTVALNQPNSTYDFIPATLFANHGAGTYQVVYKYTDASGCANTLTSEIEIIEELDATFTIGGLPFATAQANYCVNDAAVVLKGHDDLVNNAVGDVSSVFTGNGASGTGLVSGSFNPGDASVLYQPNANTITHTVIHTVNGKSCPSPIKIFDVYVTPVNASIDGLLDEYCSNVGIQTISANELDRTKVEATFSATKNGNPTSFLTDNGDNTADIDPSVGSGIYEISMSFTQLGDGCDTLITRTVEVLAADPVTFSGITDGQKICLSSSAITLRGDMPSGGMGNFSIAPYIVDGIDNAGTDDLGNIVVDDDGVAILNPAVLSIGPYTIRYEYTNGAGCSTYAEKSIEIVSAPTNLFDITVSDKNGNAYGAYCIDDVAPDRGVKIGLSGSNTGVTYELLFGGLPFSTPITFEGTGSAFYFQEGTPAADMRFTDEGVYTVRALQNGCDAIMNGSILVEQYELVLEEDSKTDVSCIGLDNGVVTLRTTGGSGVYEYSIYSIDGVVESPISWQSSTTFNGLKPATYKFSVRDMSSAACEAIDELEVVIDEPSKITITEDATLNTNVGCVPCIEDLTCEGSATISVLGGTPDYSTYPGVGYEISWSTGGADYTETGMPSGLHSVTVTDGNGCVQSININIGENAPLTLAEDVDPALHIDNVCHGDNNGSYVVTATGGSGTYQFALTDPSVSPTTWLESNYGALGDQYQVKNLLAGTYNIWVRDRDSKYNRCNVQVTTPITITEPAALSLVEESQIGITCNGAIDGSFIVRASGGESGTYEFTQSDPALGGAVWVDANNSTDAYEVTGIGAGNYTVWMRDKGNISCSYVSTSVTLSDVSALSYVLDEHTQVKCKSDNTGRLEVTAQGGSGNYVYQWEHPAGTVISTEKFAEGLEAGDYFLTISDAVPTSCGPITHTFTITEPSVSLDVNLINIIDNECGAVSNGSIQVDVVGGSAPYNITWSNGATNTESLSGLKPGDYTLSVEDAEGCLYDNAATPYTVGELSDISLVPTTSVITHNNCYNANSGSIAFQVVGGSGMYEFRLQGDEVRDWVTPVPVNADTYRFDDLFAGTYEVLVRDAGNSSCEYSLGSFTVTQPNELLLVNNAATGIHDVTCHGGNDGWITVTASGGSGDYDYSLDNGATWTSIAQINSYTFSNLSKGTYLIKVRDFNNPSCISSTTLILDVQEPDEIKGSVIAVSDVTCYDGNDGSITLSAQGGSGNYDYYCVQTNTWQDDAIFILPKGTYTFQVQDENVTGCISSPTADAIINAPMDFSTSVPVIDNISCYGKSDGTITLDTKYTDGSSGLFEYSIDNGVTFKASPLTGVAAGTYTLQIREANNISCVKTYPTSITVIEPDELTQVATIVKDVQCYGDSNGEIKIDVSGGIDTKPYTYQWSGISDANGGKTEHVTNLAPGSYSVSITDFNGCSILPIPSYSIGEPDEIEADTSITHIAIGGQSTGEIVINNIIGGPTSNYDVEWDDGSTNMSRTGLPAGDYYFIVNVRDASNVILCTRRYDITLIDLSAPLDFSLTPTDAACYGEDGSVEVKINSGNPPYDITWSKGGTVLGSLNSSNLSNVIPLPYGVYEVNVVDDAGGNVTKTVTVGQPDDFAIVGYVVTDKECYGDLAKITVDITGDAWDNAVAPKGDAFMVTWIDPDGLTIAQDTYTAEATQSNLSKAGNYTVNVYHVTSGTCIKSDVVTVSDPQPLGITESVNDVTCYGGSDGQISITPIGRPSGHGFSYVWEVDNGSGWTTISGETAASLTNKEAALYRVTIQSTSSSCNYTSSAIKIAEPEKIEAIIAKDDIITCYGDDAGTIKITNIEGGTGPYKYILNGDVNALGTGVTNFNIEDLVSQSYSLTIEDVKGCLSDVYSINIEEPEELKFAVNTASIDCESPNTGEITLEVQGGRKDASGNQKYLITASPDGDADIVLSIITNSTSAPVVVSDPLLQNLPADTYEIKVKDVLSDAVSKCEVVQEVVLEHVNATADVVNATCFGVNNGSIKNVVITGTSNYSYNWKSIDGGTGLDNANLDQSGLSDGTYTLTVIDHDRGDCAVAFDFVVAYKHTIDITGDVSDVICNGEESGAIDITVTGLGTNATYNWTGPAGFTFGDATTADQSMLAQGTYTVSLETTLEGQQCLASQDFTVNEPDPISYNAYFEYTDCEPFERTLKIENVKGGTGTYTYTWNGPAFNPAVPTDPKEVLITQGGTYSITVKDKNLCQLAKDVIVPDEISIDYSVTHLKCYNSDDGAIDISDIYGGSGAFTFLWTYPDGSTTTDRNIDELVAGKYTLVITDKNENVGGSYCSREFSFTITQPTELAISPAVVNVSCFGLSDGQIEIGVMGGTAPYTYNWNPVVGSNLGSNKNLYNLPADDYTVTVTDDNKCVASLTIPVVQDDKLVLSADLTDTQCDGLDGEIDLKVEGGSGDVGKYMYNWSSLDGAGLVSNVQDQTGLSGGVYSVVVTDTLDGRNCMEELSVALTHPIEIINERITPVDCSGNNNGAINFDVVGGDGNYSYEWTAVAGYGGDPTRLKVNDKTQTGLSEGRYQVVITDGRTDPSGTDCALTYTFDVDASTGLNVEVQEYESNMCYGVASGKLVASVTGGSGTYTYKWDGVVGTAEYANLLPGVYQLEVEDDVLHCKWIQSYEINGPDKPLAFDNIEITDVLCYGESTGAIKVSASGGTVAGDYTYIWNGPSLASGANPTNLVAGLYDLKIIDDEGCELDLTGIEIKQPATHVKLSNPIIENVTTVGGDDGKITVDVEGGVAPYSYKWYNSLGVEVGDDNRVQTDLKADTYRVEVTDKNGCTFELINLTVIEPGAALGFNKTKYDVAPCNGTDNGEIYITSIYGGYPIGGSYYRIQISGPGVNVDENNTSWHIDNLVPGDYTIVITDEVGVQVSETITIQEPTPLSIVTTHVSDVDCYEGSTGEIKVTVSGGKPDASGNYKVLLESLEKGLVATKLDAKDGVEFSFDNIPAGNYTITAYDGAHLADDRITEGCSVSDFKLITQPEAQVSLSSVSGDDYICLGESYKLAVNTDLATWDFVSQGKFRITLYDGFESKEYDIDETPYEIEVTPSSTRTYQITRVHKTDGSLCSQGETDGSKVTVNVNELPTASISGPSEVCEDGTVQLSVVLTGVKPFVLTWRDALNGTSKTETIDAYTYNFTDQPVGDAKYMVLNITDANGCSNTGSGEVAVSVNDKPQVALSGSTDICQGEKAILEIGLVKGIKPFTITYTANGVEGTLVVSPTGTVYNWEVAPDGVSTVYEIINVVDSKGCVMDISSPLQAQVIVNPLPAEVAGISSTTDLGQVCQGATNIDYSIAAVDNATSYIWSADAGMSIISGNGTTNVLVDFERTFSGGYIRVYAENACGSSPVEERWVNASLLPEEITVAPSGEINICEGETGLIYTINPISTHAASYEWDVPTGLIIVGDATGSSIVVDHDPNVPYATGDIRVRPINACSNDEPWSPGLTVNITPLPVPYAGEDERICGTEYTLDADPISTDEEGVWTIIEGSAQFENPSTDKINPNGKVNNLSQGENIFVWTVTNTVTSCGTSDTVIIYNDQVTVNAMANQYTVCDGTVELSGTPLSSVDAPSGTALWSTPDGAMILSASDATTTATNLASGENTFVWTIYKGACFSSAEVKVINNKPTDAIIYNASDVIISKQDLPCGDDFTTLKASVPTAGETGYWRIESGSVSIDDVNSPTIHISNILTGDHVLSWNILNGSCTTKETVTIRNNSFDVDAGKDETTCDGSIWLAGTDTIGGAIGQWTIIEGTGSFADAESPTTLVTGLSQANNGRNVFRWTLRRNGCESYDEVVITNDMPSVAEIQGSVTDVDICDYELNLNAVDPVYGNGIWTVVNGNGVFDDRTVHNTGVKDIGIGSNTYRWTVYNNTCSSSVEFTVHNFHVDAYAGADTAVCESEAKLNAALPSEGTGSWSVASGLGSGSFYDDDELKHNGTVQSLASGDNLLVWTVQNGGCVTTDTVVVTNNKPTPVSAIPWTSTDESYAPLYADNPVVGSGVWTLLEGRGDIDDPYSPSTTVRNLFPNINIFRWTVTKLNCSDYVDVEVQSGALAQAEAGWDQTDLCEDYTYMDANLPENTFGEWTVVSGFVKFENDHYNDPEVKIYDISPGRNVLKWTLRFAGDGTESTEDTVVIINNKPTDADAGYDISVCGDFTTFDAVPPVEGSAKWTVLSGGGFFTDETDPKTTITGLAPGRNVIKYQVTKEGCHSYDTVMVYNYEPSEAVAGEDQVVCADSAYLRPTAPKYGTGSWRVIEGAGKGKDEDGNYTSEISGNYVHGLAPGKNVLVWEVQVEGADADCINRDTIEIINNEPTVAFAGHSRPVCTDTVSLSANTPIYGVGTWTLISGSGEIVDSSLTNTLVKNLGKGENRFRWSIDNNGCPSTSDVVISNDLIDADAGYDQVNCADTAVLEGNNPLPGEGTWGILGGSGSANFDDNLNQYTTVRNLDKGENILTWTIQNNSCTSVSQVRVVNNEPSLPVAGDNKSTCENTFVLGASSPEVGDGFWTIRSGGGKFEDEYSPSTRVDSLKFGDNIFRWTVENEGCVLYDDVQISYNKIQAEAGGDQENCSDETFLEANSAEPGIGTWTVVGGGSQARFIDSHDAVTEVVNLAKGKNRLRWSINYKGCITEDEVEIINHSPSTSYAGNTQELCVEETVLDATEVEIGSGKWEIVTGSAIIAADQLDKPKAVITNLSKGENVFRWVVTSDNGLCSSEDDVLIINNTPSEPYAGKSEEYCSNDIVLKATAPDFGVGRWSFVEGGGNFDDPALPQATVYNLNEGVNILRWTISQGNCRDSSDIVITNNTPTVADAGPDISDCKDYAFLDANEPTQGAGYWTRTSGNAIYADDTDPKTKVEGLTHGDNILMWNIKKGGCISFDEIVVRNNIPDKAEAGTNKETCEDYLTLNAKNPTTGTGTWIVLSGHGDFDDPTSPTSIVRNLELGENKFKWEVAYGSCTTEDVVEIISNKADPYAGEDDISYEPNYELKASNPGDLGAVWTVVAGEGDFEDLTFYNTRVLGLKEGVNTFRWTMDVNGCITYDDVSIEYKLVPDAAFKVDTFQGCYPLTVQFTNQSTGGSTYSWDFGDGKTSVERNPKHTFNYPGEYTVTLTAPGPDNVDGTYQKDILVYDHPVAEFSVGPEVVYIPGGAVRCYDQSVDAVSYLWDFGDGSSETVTQVNPSYEYDKTGFYSVSLKVISEFGCEDEIVKMDAVEVRQEGFLVFPNSFMPRPDGGAASSVSGDKTAIFKPIYQDVESYKVQIFNRWGQLIYESEDIEEGWNGFFNGTLSPQAVYVYKATGTFKSGTVFNETGSVLLVR